MPDPGLPAATLGPKKRGPKTPEGKARSAQNALKHGLRFRQFGRPAALRARVERLLDRTVPRQAVELDLAEAICAVKWPKWPEYHGPVDLWLLKQVLRGFVIDSQTLHWLGGKEIERLCRAALQK